MRFQVTVVTASELSRPVRTQSPVEAERQTLADTAVVHSCIPERRDCGEEAA